MKFNLSLVLTAISVSFSACSPERSQVEKIELKQENIELTTIPPYPIKKNKTPKRSHNEHDEATRLLLDDVRKALFEQQEKLKGLSIFPSRRKLSNLEVDFETPMAPRSFEVPMNAGELTLSIPENWYIGQMTPSTLLPYVMEFIPDVENYTPENLGISVYTPNAYVSLFSFTGDPKYTGISGKRLFQSIEFDTYLFGTNCQADSYCDITAEIKRGNPRFFVPVSRSTHRVSNRIQVLNRLEGTRFKYSIKVITESQIKKWPEFAISCDKSNVCIQVSPIEGDILSETALLSTVQYLEGSIR